MEERLANLRALAAAVVEADRFGAIEPTAATDGFSGAKVTGLLQRLARLLQGSRDAVYLEVGIFRGRSLLSVAKAAPDVLAVGIDNFSQFDPRGENRSIIEAEARRLGCSNLLLIDSDFEAALPKLVERLGDRRVGLYFVDGPHDYRSQRVSLDLALSALSPESSILVDDANYEHVRQADRDFLLSRPGFRLLFEAYTRRHPVNEDTLGLEEARRSWWNGVHLIVRDAAGELPPMLPEAGNYRRIAENAHLVEAARYGALAPEAVAFADAFLRFRPLQALRGLARLIRARRRLAPEQIGSFAAGNTFSESLPSSRMNPGLAEKDSQRG
jgi:hypothetical protein